MRRYSRRELPPYRHRPGRTPHPERHPEGHSYGRPEPLGLPLEASSWRENEEYLAGVDLFNAGYFWEAHVAWEAVWKATPSSEPASTFLQALVQLAAAFLKREVDQPAGARKLLGRSVEKLRVVRQNSGSGVFRGVDLDALIGRAEDARSSSGAPLEIELELELELDSEDEPDVTTHTSND